MLRIPFILEKDSFLAVREYNYFHSQEHMDIANWLNTLAKAKGLSIVITYYSLPILDPNDKKTLEVFFNTNWKQHMVFWDYFNRIGQTYVPPIFFFPKNYPTGHWDMDIENFVKLEYEIHMLFWRGIDVLRSS